MSGMYKHIIWDWNGTLFNDVSLCVSVMNSLLARRDLPQMTIDRYRAIFTFPVHNYYQELGFDFARDSFEDLSKEFISQYETRRYECSLYPYTKPVLDQANASGISQSILSAYLQSTLVELVQTFGLERLFERLTGLDNIYASGKIEQGRRLMAGLGYTGSEVLLIGDTVHDFEVARAIGIDCLLVAHGHHSKERLQQCGAPVVDSIKDLIQDRLIVLGDKV